MPFSMIGDARRDAAVEATRKQSAMNEVGAKFERRMQIAQLIEALSKIIDPDFEISVTLKRKPIPTYVGPTTDHLTAGGEFAKVEIITNFVAEDGAMFSDSSEWRHSDPGIVLCSDPEVR